MDEYHLSVMDVLIIKLGSIYKVRQALINPNVTSDDNVKINQKIITWLNNHRDYWAIIEKLTDYIAICYENNIKCPKLIEKIMDIIFIDIIEGDLEEISIL